jgi:hypothetical protein
MTYIDFGSGSRSTIHILKFCLQVGNLRVKLENPMLTLEMGHNVKLGHRPIVTLKVGHGQLYINQTFGFGEGISLQSMKILALLSPKISCIMRKQVNDL